MMNNVYLCYTCLNIFVPRKEVNSFKVTSTFNDLAHFCGQECLDKFVQDKKTQRAAKERMEKEHEAIHNELKDIMMGPARGHA